MKARGRAEALVTTKVAQREPGARELWKAGGRTNRAARFDAGRALRKAVPRSRQGAWEPSPDRGDPIDLLIAGDRIRVDRLLPIKYGRMATSPFAFFRGSAAVMAQDLAREPSTGLEVQMVGDGHLANFGLFATPERNQVFDVNDFDETLRGPWEWDVKRLSTSLVLVAALNGYPRRTGRQAVEVAMGAYRQQMHRFGRMRYLDAWYAHLDREAAALEVGGPGRRLLRRELAKARRRTNFNAFPKLTRVRQGRVRIRADPPLLDRYPAFEDEATARRVFAEYRITLPPERRTLFDRYHLADVAEKVVGVGSVGTRCGVGLFLGDSDVLDPLFLQIKEVLPAVGEPYLGRSPYSSHAERVVVGQRMIQEASDVFLGWGSSGGHDFYVRQLRDMKFASDLTMLRSKALFGQAELCAIALARAHARTGDAAAIAGYLGEGGAFDRALVAFAVTYAQQVAQDHHALLEAVRRGRLTTVKA